MLKDETLKKIFDILKQDGFEVIESEFLEKVNFDINVYGTLTIKTLRQLK